MNQEKELRVSLCHTDKCCPEVIVDVRKGEVLIGEHANTVTLDRKYWNEFVEMIQPGKLKSL